MEQVQDSIGNTLGELQKPRSSVDEASRFSRDLAKAQERSTANIADAMALLATQLSDLNSVTEVTQRGNYILRRLHFPEIFQRESDVKQAEEDTFGWIVGNPKPPASNIPRNHAYKSLMSFLETDGCLFFFCGKAGSGKSTMMKFLSTYSSRQSFVHSGLEKWAGSRKLVIVRMYFWSADSRLQRTMEGFYRTILFHTLSQCPELVSEIFPHESPTRPADLSIIAPFPIGELQEAFDRLVRLGQTRDETRFCYFIDGLDEYDADNQSYRALAKKLVNWSTLDSVKIICSARPYTVFRESFEGVGITLEFHELTRDDMRAFASRQFQTNLNDPTMVLRQTACLKFVEQIVTRADGVFSWASLVVRSLINGALDGETVENLERRLEECPDKIGDMFKKMLSKVDSSPSVRRRSNMLMYLAAHNPLESALNALSLTWLDEASWFEGSDLGNFPFNRQARHYSEHEIVRKHEEARKLLHSLTQGLLELNEATSRDQIPYFRYSIGFFHRSVRDFIRDHCFEPFGSEITLAESYSRLRAAEVKFLPLIPLSRSEQLRLVPYVTYLYEYTFWWFGSLARRRLSPSLSCLREFEHTIASHVPKLYTGYGHQEEFWAQVFRGTMLIGGSRSYRWESTNSGRGGEKGCSFEHWAIYWFQGRQYVAQVNDGDDPKTLSHLLSASLASDTDTTKYLLDRGRRPVDSIEIHQSQMRKISSIWAVFLRDFANVVGEHIRKEREARDWPSYLDSLWLSRLSKIMELYLQADADPSAFFLVKIPNLSSQTTTYQPPADPPNLVSRAHGAQGSPLRGLPPPLANSSSSNTLTSKRPTLRSGPRRPKGTSSPLLPPPIVSSSRTAFTSGTYRVTIMQMLSAFNASNLMNVERIIHDATMDTKENTEKSTATSKTRDEIVNELLPSPQLLVQNDWLVLAVILPGWDESIRGDFEVRVF